MSTTFGASESSIDVTAFIASLGVNKSPLTGGWASLTAELLGTVIAISRELFPGKCDFTTEFDFEHVDDRYLVVNVEATGEPREIVERSHRWHERIRQLAPELSDAMRLSIVPRT